MRANLIWLGGLTACSMPLVDVSSLKIETWPSGYNQILARGDTIRLSFSEPVDRSSAQALLSVSSADGVVPGDMAWSGNTLIFSPVPELSPSRRYSLEYTGQVTLADGRRFDVAKEVPFFSVSASSGVLLTARSPADGATASVNEPILLTFSQSVDPISFIQGFTLSPTAASTVRWSVDGTTVTVEPRGWPANALITWQLSTAVKSAAGLPLAVPARGTFVTNADQTPPSLVSLVSAVPVGTGTAVWTDSGGGLDTLRSGDGLLLTMSEPVSLSSLSSGFHLSPPLKGHWNAQRTQALPYEYVFVPEEAWRSGTRYEVQLTGVQDLAENSLSQYVAAFSPAIPYLRVESISLTGTSTVTCAAGDLNSVNQFPVCVPSGVAGALQIAVTLAFSEVFSASDRARFAVVAFCEPLFPDEGATVPPTLVTVSFMNDKTAVLTYQGFLTAVPSTPYYYRIRIPGGPAGLTTSAGNTLKEDVWLDFTTGS